MSRTKALKARLIGNAGVTNTMSKPAATGVYVADKGIEGEANRQRWRNQYHAEVIAPPRRKSLKPWSSEERKWFARVRQMVETVFGRLHGKFGLEDERPHEVSGLGARLAAKAGLHNFCTLAFGKGIH